MSVSDKAGIVQLGRGLVEGGYTLLASGGTASTLEGAGLQVREEGEGALEGAGYGLQF